MAFPVKGEKRREIPVELLPRPGHAVGQPRRRFPRFPDLPSQFVPLLLPQEQEIFLEGGGKGDIRGLVHLLPPKGKAEFGAHPGEAGDRRGPLDEVRQQEGTGGEKVPSGGEECGPELRLPARNHDGVQRIGNLLPPQKLPPSRAFAQAEEQEPQGLAVRIPPVDALGVAGGERLRPRDEEVAREKGGGAKAPAEDGIPLVRGNVLHAVCPGNPHPSRSPSANDHFPVPPPPPDGSPSCR